MIYPRGVYMSPRTAIARYQAVVDAYGEDFIKHSGRFKPEGELLISALFLLGIQTVTGNKYYIRPSEDKSPNIDIEAVTWSGDPKPRFAVFDIQITEYERHTDDVMTVIARKIAKQGPVGQENRDLLVNVRDHGGEALDPGVIAAEVAKLEPTFHNVWILVQDAHREWRFYAVWVWPQVHVVTFDIREQLDHQHAPDCVRLTKGPDGETLAEACLEELPLP